MGALAALLLAVSFSVTSAEVCRAVEDGRCVGGSDRFPSDAGSLYFLTRYEGNTRPTAVRHVWRRGDAMVLEVPFQLLAPQGRVHSSRSVTEDDEGPWNVRLLDGSGRELARVDFRVEPPPETEPTPAPGAPVPSPGSPAPTRTPPAGPSPPRLPDSRM